MLHETFQLRYIDLMCLRCEGEIPGSSVEELAWHLRLETEEMRSTLEKFTEAGLWKNGDVVNWEDKQYQSDTSTERVRKFRKQQQETPAKRSETVSVTPSESESESDSETERERRGPHTHTPGDQENPEGSPATQRQVSFARSVLRKAGKTLEQWKAEKRVSGAVTSEQVDEILATHSQENNPAKSEREKAETRNALDRQLAAVFHQSGPKEAKQWIEGHPGYRGHLNRHLDFIMID